MSLPPRIEQLHAFYGAVPAPPKDLFAFFVWEVLSRDVLPARRDLAWQALHRIPALTPDAMFRAAPKKLVEAVALIGSARDERLDLLRKGVAELRRYREIATRVERPQSMRDALRALQRVTPLDRPARHRALLFVAGFRMMPVDRGIARVAVRLGLTSSERAGRTRRALAALLPADLDAYRAAAVYLGHHASHACAAVAPHCHVCPLRLECPSAR